MLHRKNVRDLIRKAQYTICEFMLRFDLGSNPIEPICRGDLYSGVLMCGGRGLLGGEIRYFFIVSHFSVIFSCREKTSLNPQNFQFSLLVPSC